jgi:hypothetical protein
MKDSEAGHHSFKLIRRQWSKLQTTKLADRYRVVAEKDVLKTGLSVPSVSASLQMP